MIMRALGWIQLQWMRLAREQREIDRRQEWLHEQRCEISAHGRAMQAQRMRDQAAAESDMDRLCQDAMIQLHARRYRTGKPS